jgi:hypothetical protein
VTYGNLAYDNYAYDYDYIREKQTNRTERRARQERAAEPTAKRSIGNKPKKVKKISFAAKLVSIAVVAASAIFMIVQFVEVKETLSKLNDMQDQYAFEQSVTSQKSFELEQSVDLSKIEQEAENRLGMQRPDRHQIVYIDVPQNDVTEQTAGDVEGVKNRLSEMWKSVKSHIVDFFSI